ncbi:hypothetical protein L0244_38300, partial [bacterium]|nr:hypothetical protein [bacterium]
AVLEASALFDSNEYRTHTRVAAHDDKIYVDLVNEDWQAIEIDSFGYRVVDSCPVKFIRNRGMLSLPIPSTSGDVSLVRNFHNLDERNSILYEAFLIHALDPHGPYSVLNLLGEHGAGKSTLCAISKKIIDPNRAFHRGQPRDERDVMIAAKNGWLLCLDNLSGLPVWLSDVLARISTGAGFSTRELYTDDEELLFSVKRPIILNSITEIATRSDLLDRSIIITLPPLADHNRKIETQFNSEFEDVLPKILAGICGRVSTALKNKSKTVLKSYPRMADFARFVVASDPSAGESFLEAYMDNRQAANDLSLEASVITAPLHEFMIDKDAWNGTATELLECLDDVADEKTKRRKDYPQDGSRLSNILRRLAANFRRAGIDIQFIKQGKERTRIIQIVKAGKSASAAPATSASDDKPKDGTADGQMEFSDSQSTTSSASATTIADGADGESRTFRDSCLRHRMALVPSEFGPICPACFEEIDQELGLTQ